MTWTYGKKPKLIAAAARNVDGTWAVGLANFTHASFTDRRDEDDRKSFPAEIFDVTVVIDELRTTGDFTMEMHRSNHGTNNRPAGIVTFTHGRATMHDVVPCDLITLRCRRVQVSRSRIHHEIDPHGINLAGVPGFCFQDGPARRGCPACSCLSQNPKSRPRLPIYKIYA